jgi:uncharacterized membrane protein YgaE (UPF0421/DUF939 family)
MAAPETRISHFDALIFSAKASVSALIALLLFRLTGRPGEVWAAVSAVIVTQPSLHPSLRASLTRIIANLIGASVGLGMAIALRQELLSLAVGILLTGMACHFIRLDDALRPAYAAVIIVIMSPNPDHWHDSLDRVFAVVVGCVCTLAVGFVFDKVSNLFRTGQKEATSTGEQNE